MPPPVPFRIAVPDADLADLHARLKATRWPDEIAGNHWEAGIPLAVMKKLVDHWAVDFDWRKLEAKLNARPQFRWGYADPAAPPGTPPLHIHFFHLKGRSGAAATAAAATPRPACTILMLHGWPGSFLEFEGVLEGLCGFDLVIPSLPGYGFSDAPTVPGWGVRTAPGAREAVASLAVEDGATLELALTLPPSWPLRPASVAVRRAVGVPDARLRRWMLAIAACLRAQNGGLAGGVRLWRANVAREFAGLEECLICYAIVAAGAEGGGGGGLPRKACRTCGKKFHGGCLYKWFRSSAKAAACPHCQAEWGV